MLTNIPHGRSTQHEPAIPVINVLCASDTAQASH